MTTEKFIKIDVDLSDETIIFLAVESCKQNITISALVNSILKDYITVIKESNKVTNYVDNNDYRKNSLDYAYDDVRDARDKKPTTRRNIKKIIKKK